MAQASELTLVNGQNTHRTVCGKSQLPLWFCRNHSPTWASVSPPHQVCCLHRRHHILAWQNRLCEGSALAFSALLLLEGSQNNILGLRITRKKNNRQYVNKQVKQGMNQSN